MNLYWVGLGMLIVPMVLATIGLLIVVAWVLKEGIQKGGVAEIVGALFMFYLCIALLFIAFGDK